MKLAYVDTSCLLAIAFDEPGARAMAIRLGQFQRLLSSNLLEAELRAALLREGIRDSGEKLLSWITWVYPNRPLSKEIDRIASTGYLKGADLWHLACAMFISPECKELAFLTLDKRQADAAKALGFSS